MMFRLVLMALRLPKWLKVAEKLVLASTTFDFEELIDASCL